MAVDEARKRLRNVNGERVICFCPRCREPHETYMLYTGRSRLPRVFCAACKYAIERSECDYSECYPDIRLTELQNRGL